MAIRHTYAYRFTLAREGDGDLRGVGAVDPAFGAPVEGFWGQFPMIHVDDRELRLDTNPAERPGWWVRGEARLRAAEYQRSHLPVDPHLVQALVKPGDELRLGLDANARPTLAVQRDGHPVFAVGPASCDLDDPGSADTILRDLVHVEEALLPRGDPAPPWRLAETWLMDHGPWRLAMLQEKARGPWGLIASWCAYPVALGIPDPTLLAIAHHFLAARFHHEPW